MKSGGTEAFSDKCIEKDAVLIVKTRIHKQIVNFDNFSAHNENIINIPIVDKRTNYHRKDTYTIIHDKHKYIMDKKFGNRLIKLGKGFQQETTVLIRQLKQQQISAILNKIVYHIVEKSGSDLIMTAFPVDTNIFQVEILTENVTPKVRTQKSDNNVS